MEKLNTDVPSKDGSCSSILKGYLHCVKFTCNKYIDCIQMVNIPSNKDRDHLLWLIWNELISLALIWAICLYCLNLYWTLNVRMVFLQSTKQLYGNDDFNVNYEMSINRVIVHWNFNIVWANSPYPSTKCSDGDTESLIICSMDCLKLINRSVKWYSIE